MTSLAKSVLALLLAWALAGSLGCVGQNLEDAGSEAGAEPGSAGSAGSEASKDAAGSEDTPRVFGVYALSRGKGVPEEAREAMKAVAAIVEADRERGIAVRSERTRLGLEGETRLCIEYDDEDAAAAALRSISEAVEGVDLMNLEVESCMRQTEPS